MKTTLLSYTKSSLPVLDNRTSHIICMNKVQERDLNGYCRTINIRGVGLPEFQRIIRNPVCIYPINLRTTIILELFDIYIYIRSLCVSLPSHIVKSVIKQDEIDTNKN